MPRDLVPDTARLPSQAAIDRARLPVVYEQAKKALSQCERVDECKTWGDKASAIASYARQADDKTLLNHALRIQARAQRRVGELLEHYKLKPKGGRPTKNGVAAHTVSQRAAAQQHGLSKQQEVAAKRAAAIPHDEFEAAVESDEPPTKQQLSEMGKKAAAAPPQPVGFYEATHLMGALRRLNERCSEWTPSRVAGGVKDHELADALAQATAAADWLREFQSILAVRKP